MKTFDTVEDHQLEGEVFIIPTEFGGRQSPILSGYRGQFFWHINHESGTDWLAESFFENNKAEPGQTTRIKIRLGGTICELGRSTGMPVGRQFALREGSKVVAVGVITKSEYKTAEQGGDGDAEEAV